MSMRRRWVSSGPSPTSTGLRSSSTGRGSESESSRRSSPRHRHRLSQVPKSPSRRRKRGPSRRLRCPPSQHRHCRSSRRRRPGMTLRRHHRPVPMRRPRMRRPRLSRRPSPISTRPRLSLTGRGCEPEHRHLAPTTSQHCRSGDRGNHRDGLGRRHHRQGRSPHARRPVRRGRARLQCAGGQARRSPGRHRQRARDRSINAPLPSSGLPSSAGNPSASTWRRKPVHQSKRSARDGVVGGPSCLCLAPSWSASALAPVWPSGGRCWLRPVSAAPLRSSRPRHPRRPLIRLRRCGQSEVTHQHRRRVVSRPR